MNDTTAPPPSLADTREGLRARRDELHRQTAADNDAHGAIALKAAQGDAAAAKELAALNQRTDKAETELQAIAAALVEVEIQVRTQDVCARVEAAEVASGGLDAALANLTAACATFDNAADALAAAWDTVEAAQANVRDMLHTIRIAKPLQPGDLSSAAAPNLQPLLSLLSAWLPRSNRGSFGRFAEHSAERVPRARRDANAMLAAARAYRDDVIRQLRNGPDAKTSIGDLQQQWSDDALAARRAAGWPA